MSSRPFPATLDDAIEQGDPNVWMICALTAWRARAMAGMDAMEMTRMAAEMLDALDEPTLEVLVNGMASLRARLESQAHKLEVMR